jgi:F-type H+-transporting ATPase subunit alpha
MKKIAGRLRVDLAQYRELAAFAQLSSDLDKVTKAQLDRGQHMVELLKQPQYTPIPVEEQTMIIWVAANGYLDDVPLPRVRAFEQEFYTFMRNRYPEVGKLLREKKDLTEDAVSGLKKAAGEFKSLFGAK